MQQTTSFHKEVRHRLIDLDWTAADLAKAVSERTGLFCDDKYLSKIFNGRRKAPRIRAAVCQILHIGEE